MLVHRKCGLNVKQKVILTIEYAKGTVAASSSVQLFGIFQIKSWSAFRVRASTNPIIPFPELSRPENSIGPSFGWKKAIQNIVNKFLQKNVFDNTRW